MVLREDNPDATIADADEISWADNSDSNNDKNTTATLFGDYIDARIGTVTNKEMADFTNSIFADGQHLEVRNTSGVTLNPGDVVFISGFNVGQNLAEVDQADASSAATMPAIGLIAHASIANNANGAVIISGTVLDLDTSSFGANDELFVSETPGVLTDTKPTGTALIQKMGNVLRSNNGAGMIELFGPMQANDPDGIQSLIVAASDETTDLTTGTAKTTFRMPYGFTLIEVRASVTIAPTGSVLTVDINETGSTILSTKITIDATEKTSTTAVDPPVISDSSLADDAEITIDIDTIGSTIAGAGLKITLIGRKT